jgi:TetR/AcrR family fatty acid metabolism transcriptional regulator
MNDHSFSSMARALRLSRSPVPDTDKRVLILDAATRVFAERGFFAAQVADIARRAGIAAGTVYLYFRSKDELLLTLFDRTMQDAIREGQDALRDIADPTERLRCIARMHLERLGRDRNLAVVFQVELRQSTKFMARLSTTRLRDYLGLIRDTIADGQARGVFRTQVPATLGAKIFFGALDEMATNWILSDRRYTLADDADVVVDVFLHGVRAS